MAAALVLLTGATLAVSQNKYEHTAAAVTIALPYLAFYYGDKFDLLRRLGGTEET